MSIYPQVNWPPTWYGIIKHDERFIQITEVQKTTWTKPPDLWIKNAGWSVHDNPGKIGAGGILRYQEGKIILSYTTPLGNGTNNQVEIGATIF